MAKRSKSQLNSNNVGIAHSAKAERKALERKRCKSEISPNSSQLGAVGFPTT